MMKKIVVILLILTGPTAFAQPTSGDISIEKNDTSDTTLLAYAPLQSFETVLLTAFKTGNAAKIASYFGDNVDLSILGKANLYSKSQAQQILQHFFTENTPSTFEIIHKGKGKDSQYFIGELVSADDKAFRVTIHSKTTGSAKSIISLTIEPN